MMDVGSRRQKRVQNLEFSQNFKYLYPSQSFLKIFTACVVIARFEAIEKKLDGIFSFLKQSFPHHIIFLFRRSTNKLMGGSRGNIGKKPFYYR